MALRRIAAMALIGASLLALPGAAFAASPITVEVFTGDPCIAGTGPANKEVIATLRTRGGHVRGRFRTMTDSGGGWSGCFLAAVNGTDRLRVIVGNQDRTVRIPRLEPEIDRSTDTIEGFAKPDDIVFAQIIHYVTFTRTTEHTLATQAGPDGRYVFDTTGEVNLRGGDSVLIFGPHGDDTYGAFVLVPHMNVLDANNVITGTANNGTDLRFELRRSDGTLKADVTAGTTPLVFGISLYTVSLYKNNGTAAYPVSGDRISSSFASDAVLRMPSGVLQANPANDVVSGQCMRSAPYMLQVESEVFFGRTNASGRLTRDVTNRMNVRRGDFLVLTCMYPSGDTWAMSNIAR